MLITPEYVFKDVTHITPEWLAAKGITALVLDIDNTLTADRSQELPDAKIYVQSITPVRPEVSAQANHAGLNRDRLCHINNELAAIALEKDCYFLNLWEVLADENGDLIESYAQPDGYHIKPEGYAVWVDYLCSHTME